MPKSPKSHILVLGATGQQGGSVARHLLAAGIPVRALVRNIKAPKALQLKEHVAELVAGNFENRQSLEVALRDCTGVFSVQNFWEKGIGYEGEVRQGKLIADLAAQAKIQHFVQSTMAHAKSVKGVRHFESKREIEAHIDSIKLPRTFLGTVYFMDNFLDPTKGGSLTFPTLSGTLHPDTKMHLLFADDIGKAVCRIFQIGESLIGHQISLVGDFLTVAQMKDLYQNTTGRRAKRFSIPKWLLGLLNREFKDQLEWHNEINFSFEQQDAESLLGFKPKSFAEFIRQNATKLEL